MRKGSQLIILMMTMLRKIRIQNWSQDSTPVRRIVRAFKKVLSWFGVADLKISEIIAIFVSELRNLNRIKAYYILIKQKNDTRFGLPDTKWRKSYFKGMHWIGLWYRWHRPTVLLQLKLTAYELHSRKSCKELMIYERKKSKLDSSEHWVFKTDWWIYEEEKAKEAYSKADPIILIWRVINESNIIIFNQKNIKSQIGIQLQETQQSWT